MGTGRSRQHPAEVPICGVSATRHSLCADLAYHQSVSPDGQCIAFIVGRQGRGRQLWVRSLDSADAEVLAGTEGAASLFWSPDSQFLPDSSQQEAGKAQTLKRVPARGGPVVTLSPNVGHVRGSYGTWRSDIILFAPDAAGGVSAVSPSGGDPKPVSRIDPSHTIQSYPAPSFLPDGDRFLYLAQPSNTIYLASLSSPSATPLTHLANPQGCLCAAWLFALRSRRCSSRPAF